MDLSARPLVDQVASAFWWTRWSSTLFPMGDRAPETSDGEFPPSSRRASILAQLERMVHAIRNGDDAQVESAIVALSRRSRLLAPLTLVVGAFAMLFQGVRLLFTNWRLTLVQVIPAMLIWAAMLDLKIHLVRGRDLERELGPLVVPIVVAVAVLTAAGYFLNAVFAFAISQPGAPEIRPAYERATRHLRPILVWGVAIGLALGFCGVVVPRWGKGWFGLSMSIVVGVMMVTYVAVPARLIGIRSNRSRRDKITATAVGGAIGAVVCSPPYLLGRLGIVLLGSRALFPLGIVLIVIAVPLQTGAVTATKAVKFSAKLVTSQAEALVGFSPDGAAATGDAVGADGTPAAVPSGASALVDGV
jgi:hypothetical protein